MRRVIARIWFPAVLSAAAVAPACASDHFSIERVGEKSLDAGAAVSWCQVKEVLSQRCWRCHHKDPENDAPFELCLYRDTQVPFFGDVLVWQEMQQVVSADFMPPTFFPDLVPPVIPLDSVRKQRLLDWFAQGAPMGGAGGASGAAEPPCGTPVDALQALCLSGKTFSEWNAGGAGGAGAAGAAGAANGGAAGASSAGAGGASGAGTAGAGG